MDDELTKRAYKIVKYRDDLEDILTGQVSFCVLKSDKEKKASGKIVFGECEKIPDKHRWAIPFDFTITIYEPNCLYFTDEQMDILLTHELMHVGVDLEGDVPKYYVVPHDVDEFRKIIEEHGLDWAVKR